MSVDVAELAKLTDKEVVLHVTQEDDPSKMEEKTGVIKVATEAGVGFKEKGKPGVDLILPSRIEEVALAPEKLKSVTKKHLKPIPAGGMRQHLADRHGIELEWCKNNTEEAAVEFHNTIDHGKLGHDHEAKDKADDKKDEAPAES